MVDGGIDAYLGRNRERQLDELCELLRIPSISTDPERRGDVARCAEWLAAEMRRVGLDNVTVEPTEGHPILYGEWLGAPGAPTMLIYGHYDVQPVDPIELWESPPFEPTVRDGALYARGAVDDKGQLFMHLKAIEAHMQVGGRLPVNVKCLFEGEEEIGSTHLDPFVEREQVRLAADLAVVSDTGMFSRELPSLTYGLRGLAYLQVDLAGPSGDLHSGSYGGAVANPAELLCRAIAGMKDADGRITVAGFYDRVRPLDPRERAEFARLPHDDAAYMRHLGVEALWGEAGYSTIERVWARPTLEVNGIWGGYSGEGSKTIIPARAGAKLSCRLVPDQDPDEILDLLEAHLRAALPAGVRVTFRRLGTGRPALIPIDHPAMQAAARAVEHGFGQRPVFIREGGSIPIVATFQSLLGLQTVLLGIGLPGENAHAPNEWLDLEHFYNGIRSAAFLWDELSRTDPATLRARPAS